MVIIGVQNSNERFAKAAQGVSDFSPPRSPFSFQKNLETGLTKWA
jgi:hypothetical protein